VTVAAEDPLMVRTHSGRILWWSQGFITHELSVDDAKTAFILPIRDSPTVSVPA
jgi:hypothetical protein